MSKKVQRREVGDDSIRGNEKSVTTTLLTLATLAGGLVALSTLVGFLLHGCGHVAYSSYLHEWGVDDTLFPKGADWKVVNGYYALLLQGTTLLTGMPLPLVLGAFLTLTGGLFLYRIPVARKTPFRDWLLRRHVLVQELLKSSAISAFVLYVAFTLLLIGTLVAVLPGWLGDRAWREQAQEEMARAESGEKFSYVELWRDGAMQESGSVIAISEQLIAVFDYDLKRVRVLDRTNLEMRFEPRKRK